MRLITLLILLIMCFPGVSQAELHDRGGGMIYDDIQNITWLQNANLPGNLNWDAATAWVNALSYGGYNDWRLASMDLNNDGVIVRCQLDTVSEAECRDSELGYMFFYNFGASYGDDLRGDQGFFTNIQTRQWSGTETSGPGSDSAYSFVFGNGNWFPIFKWAEDGVWAVRDGDVVFIDADDDGVADALDNCTLVANSDQRDSNGDGHGNLCDFDYTNNCVTNFLDLARFVFAFNTTIGDPNFNDDVDLDGNGIINFLDLGEPPYNFARYFIGPPGPSATACVPAL